MRVIANIVNSSKLEKLRAPGVEVNFSVVELNWTFDLGSSEV